MRTYSIIVTALVTSVSFGCADSGTVGPSNDSSGKVVSPVGTFALSTVNGEKVPMLWDEMELWKGGPVLRAYWNGGSMQFRRDSTYIVTYRHTLTGPNLPGNVQEDTYTGTWRLASGTQIELRSNSGGVQYWQTTSRLDAVMRTTSVPNLDGGEEQVVFRFVR